jgi:hypothetical protein
MRMQHEAEICTALRRLSARQRAIASARRYYEGNHPMEYGRAEFRRSVAELFADFRYNLCPIPIEALVDRLQLTSVQTGGYDAPQWDETARTVRLDAFQQEVHREALLTGQCHVLAWDAGHGPRWFMQPSHVFELAVDEDTGDVLAAVKLWRPEGKDHFRLTIYTATHALRYTMASDISASSLTKLPVLTPYTEQGPHAQSHPFRAVPAVRFANRGGVSELRDLIPLQNALNKSLLDLLLTSEAYGIPQRYVLGYVLERDPATGTIRNPLPKGGGVWVFEGNEVQVGQLQAADIAALSTSIGDNEERFARVAGLPIHFVRMGGDMPSGEALRVAESRLSAKARGRTVEFGNAWEDLCAITWRTSGVSYDAAWAPVETVSERERLESAEAKRRIGIPDSVIWSELGYTEDEIAQMTEEAEARATRSAEIAMRAFSAGGS